MSYQLNKPYSEREKMDFIANYNHNLGLYIFENEQAIFALEKNEILKNGKIEINTNYEIEQRLEEIELNLKKLNHEFEDLDKKTIRALREYGFYKDGTTYLEFYQEQINNKRNEYSLLMQEKLNLEEQLNDITQ